MYRSKKMIFAAKFNLLTSFNAVWLGKGQVESKIDPFHHINYMLTYIMTA